MLRSYRTILPVTQRLSLSSLPVLNHVRAYSTSFHLSSTSTSSENNKTIFSSSSSSLFNTTPNNNRRYFSLTPQTYMPVIHFNLADVGEGITECEVMKWYVKEGAHIHEFDKLCEVRSDKANVEISSRYEGLITKLHYKVGDVAKVGKPLCDIETGEEQSEQPQQQQQQSSASTPSGSTSTSSSSSAAAASAVHGGDAQEFQTINSSRLGPVKALATPAVRRIAREHQIDLNTVQGTGKEGRILKEDILAYVSGAVPAKRVVDASKPSTPSASTATSAAATAGAAPVQTQIGGREDKVVPISGIQRVMVKTMNAANAVPHFGYCDELVFDRLVELRQSMKSLAESKGVKLSYMPFIMKALSLALLSYPSLNAHVDAECTAVTIKGRHNIGVAMDTPEGLVVPNVKDVQDRSLLEIAEELNRLQSLGSQGKLGLNDLRGGTITLSNIGAIGGTYAKPVLFLPEVAIAALGKIQTLPRFDAQGQVKATNIVQISWSADHRVVDGATMARFSNVMKDFIENPQNMLLVTR